jgi:hypothetical protein
MVGTFDQPDFQTDTGTAYKTAIDNSIAVVGATAAQFAAHEQSSPDMTVRVDAGKLLAGTTLTNVAAQSTGTITAPVTNPRIDRIVIDASTGAVSVITGAENVSPTAPAITSGKIPVAQVALTTSTVAITNSLITDERPVAFTGGISDGDKGDITVSGGGATFTIDNDAVTYAKMQNVSATSRILGRKTAAAGDTEECTLSEILDFIGSAAQGDILYRGASAWARLAAGTSGQYLKTNGAGANPAWADVSSSLAYLDTQTASTSSSLDFTSLITSSYDVYVFFLLDIRPATDATLLKVRTSTNNGSSYDAAGYPYALRNTKMDATPGGADTGNSGADGIFLVPSAVGIGNAAAEGISGIVILTNPLGTTIKKGINFEVTYLDGAGVHYMAKGAGYSPSTSDVDAVQFIMDSGNITSGKIEMYGYKNS